MLKKVTKIIKYKYFPSKQDKVHKKWRADRGDSNLIPNHDLNEDSLVMDIGGYKGDFAAEISARYNCNIKVFEPVPSFVESMNKRFGRNKKIEVFGFGLGGESHEDSISVNEFASSTFRKVGEDSISIKIKGIVDWLQENKIGYISLMKINIEGGEYDLLDKLIQKGYIDKIENLQIQFHAFYPNALNRMKTIQDELSKTHELTYQYPFIWENWKLKSK